MDVMLEMHSVCHSNTELRLLLLLHHLVCGFQSSSVVVWNNYFFFFFSFFLTVESRNTLHTINCITEHVCPTCTFDLVVQHNNTLICLGRGKNQISFFLSSVNCLTLKKSDHGRDVRTFTGWIRWENILMCFVLWMIYSVGSRAVTVCLSLPIQSWTVIVIAIWEPDAPRWALS